MQDFLLFCHPESPIDALRLRKATSSRTSFTNSCTCGTVNELQPSAPRFLDAWIHESLLLAALRWAALLGLVLSPGCYAPLRSPGIAACTLADTFRAPEKASALDLNYAMLTRETTQSFLLGPGDLIRIEIADLIPRIRRLPPVDGVANDNRAPFSYEVDTHVSESGTVLLPLVGTISVKDMTVEQARQAVVSAYSKGYMDDPKVSVRLEEASTTRVVVLGHVARPNVYELPKYENDIAHAIASAGGLVAEEADEIQVHRKAADEYTSFISNATGDDSALPNVEMLRIPLRSNPPAMIAPKQAILNDGDVVVVRKTPDEIFFVVGRLSTNNFVRFTLGRQDRDLGNGFVLPKDRDIDVVTAVAMAGYIDPIDSPTTVTVHRTLPDGKPVLIRVDLIAARHNRKENIMVRAGDIIYLNPDPSWWFRRTLDRVIPEIITSPYNNAIERWINPRRFD